MYSVCYYRHKNGGLSGGFTNMNSTMPYQAQTSTQAATTSSIPTTPPVQTNSTVISEKSTNDTLDPFG